MREQYFEVGQGTIYCNKISVLQYMSHNYIHKKVKFLLHMKFQAKHFYKRTAYFRAVTSFLNDVWFGKQLILNWWKMCSSYY